jgi:hypothetical protein
MPSPFRTVQNLCGQRPESGLAQPGGDLVVPGSGDLRGAARPGRGDPDQVAPLVGQGEEEQAVDLVFPAAVRAVVLPGASVGAHQGAVDRDDLAAGSGDLLQGTVQARGAGGEQLDDFQQPAADGGGGGDVV